MDTTQDIYYIAVRPISPIPEDINERAEELEALTGMSRADLKSRLSGSSPKVLTSGGDAVKLEAISADLRKHGIPAALIHKNEIKTRPKNVFARSIEERDNKLRLLDIDGKVVLSIDSSSKCVIVLGGREKEKIKEGFLSWHSATNNKSITGVDMLRLIFASSPVLTIFSSGSDTPVVIDAAKFNYNSLGSDNKMSIGQNMPVIISKIKERAGSSIMDIGYGISSLPFVESEPKEGFEAYSRFILLAAKGGLFAHNDESARFDTGGNQTYSLLSGLLMANALMPKGNKRKKIETEVPGFELPPAAAMQGAIIVNPGGVFSISGLLGAPWIIKFSKSAGHPVWTTLNLLIITGSGLAGHITNSFTPLTPAIVSIGLLLFTHSLVLFKRKRDMENCPTSKIGSMPMGEVEVYGEARMKYLLKAPYSLAECVYFSYEIYRTERTKNGTRDVLVESGYSGNVPFILKDKSGATTVLPKGAILHAGAVSTYSGSPLQGYFAARRINGHKIVETIISPGTELYVKGYAHRIKSAAKEREQKRLQMLTELKLNTAKLNEFDFNKDGKIDSAEWDAAVRSIDNRLAEEAMKENTPKDEVAIGEHPYGGLFYIADKSEQEIVSSFAWRIPVFMTLGILATSIGLYFTLSLSLKLGIISYIVKTVFG